MDANYVKLELGYRQIDRPKQNAARRSRLVNPNGSVAARLRSPRSQDCPVGSSARMSAGRPVPARWALPGTRDLSGTHCALPRAVL